MAADMTAFSSNLGLIAVPEGSAPLLADDPRPSYDVRLEDLLQGQQEVMNLVLGGAELQDVLHCLVLISEQVFAPAKCSISLVERDSGRVKHQAAGSIVTGLLTPLGALVADHLSHPDAAASLSGERIIIFDHEELPSEHAGKAMESGLRCCWVEPFADCGEGLSGSASFYYPTAREPDASEEHVLWIPSLRSQSA